MKPFEVMRRLEQAQGTIVLSKEECETLLGSVNYLEQVVAELLASLKRKKKLGDVRLPARAHAV